VNRLRYLKGEKIERGDAVLMAQLWDFAVKRGGNSSSLLMDEINRNPDYEKIKNNIYRLMLDSGRWGEMGTYWYCNVYLDIFSEDGWCTLRIATNTSPMTLNQMNDYYKPIRFKVEELFK
jgi:hypothetical protein